jgi:hypothetical protein
MLKNSLKILRLKGMCSEQKMFVFIVSKTFFQDILLNIQRFENRESFNSASNLPVLLVGL